MCYSGICINEDYMGNCTRYNTRTCHFDQLEREADEKEEEENE